MSETHPLQPPNRRLRTGVAAAALALALSACGASSASPTASHAPSASQPAAARCAVTPDATASATVQIAGRAFGGEATVAAGEAVIFSNEDGLGHTVTEGTAGAAADAACVDLPLGGGQSLIVTFNSPGDYQITCRIHRTMQTVVHVQ
ncbi:MAG: plastocyanin/azurin family copper-binding protein [Gemmatimonadales bacterium]